MNHIVYKRQPLLFGRPGKSPVPIIYTEDNNDSSVPFVIETLSGVRTKLVLDREMMLNSPIPLPIDIERMERKIHQIDLVLEMINENK